MITDKMIEWLLSATPEIKYYKLYHQRIQRQIDKNIENTLWLAKNHPEILLDETGFGDKPRHKRLQNLLLIIQILKPQYEVYIELGKQAKELLDLGK